MRYVVYGAGAVGGTIAARLRLAGHDVVAIARGDHLRALQHGGLRFVSPDEETVADVVAVGSPAEAELEAGDAVLLTVKSQDTPALTDASLRRIIQESAKEAGFSTMSLPSGAGHDAQAVANYAPIGMIFVPSIGGISHSPKEFSRAKDIENGANVLLGAVMKADTANL